MWPLANIFVVEGPLSRTLAGATPRLATRQGELMKTHRWKAVSGIAALVLASGAVAVGRGGFDDRDDDDRWVGGRKARNVIFFIGDGMGVSTVTAARVFSVGVDGQLVLDQFPHTALSKTYSADSITPDSAPTMTAMMTGDQHEPERHRLRERTEANDFNNDGDGAKSWTLLELAKRSGMRVGAVSTAQITHATPAATYSHVNQRNNENDIALQALPSDATYNQRLGRGVDILMGGGRRFFLPNNVMDEEGVRGARTDSRDLRAEFRAAGYNYAWNKSGFDALRSLPALGLFESGHMEWEFDRPSDLGGEPSLKDMTVKAIQLLEGATRRGRRVISCTSRAAASTTHITPATRIARWSTRRNSTRRSGRPRRWSTSAIRSSSSAPTTATCSTSRAIRCAHCRNCPIPSSPMTRVTTRPPQLVTAFSTSSGTSTRARDMSSRLPIATACRTSVLGYHNGPGYRGMPRVDPRTDPFAGLGGAVPNGPAHPAYFQEAAVPMSSETHSGEDVAIYAVGPGSELVRGTVKNTHIFQVMKRALGF